MSENNTTVLFQEKQYFRSPVLWGILFLCFAACCNAFIRFYFSDDISQVPGYYLYFIAFLCLFCGIILPIFLWKSHLGVAITPEGIYLRFKYFQFKAYKIPINRIVSAEMCTFRPILDHGGWGIRFRKNLTAYTVSGNKGVRITLSSGRKIILGSQKATEMESAIQKTINIS